MRKPDDGRPFVIRLRDPREIQRAHDAILGFLRGEAGVPQAELPEDLMRALKKLGSVLCWVLCHPGQEDAFADLLLMLETYTEACGAVLPGKNIVPAQTDRPRVN